MNDIKTNDRFAYVATLAKELAKSAFCRSKSCGIPRSTCLSLGTCDEYDKFSRELNKVFEEENTKTSNS